MSILLIAHPILINIELLFLHPGLSLLLNSFCFLLLLPLRPMAETILCYEISPVWPFHYIQTPALQGYVLVGFCFLSRIQLHILLAAKNAFQSHNPVKTREKVGTRPCERKLNNAFYVFHRATPPPSIF